MRKSWLGALAGILTLLPLAWLGFFTVTYRCDLGRYARLWHAGGHPEWLTGWELTVTLACAAIALMVAPKVIRYWRRRIALTRGEWVTLGFVSLLIGVAVFVAPLAMVDPKAKFAALLGQPTDQCVH